MPTTSSETLVTRINTNVFFKEFTFSKNDFKELDTKQQLEFADNVVWLDQLFFIYQIKQMNQTPTSNEKWFERKVKKKAVQQIKSTLNYISKYTEIQIENERGHKLDITKAKKSEKVKKIIIYSTTDGFPELIRNEKFYESTEIGLVHLFHSEDYYWICKFLVTPTEVNEYLNFRENLFLFDREISNALPEQYFLGHFFETPDANHFNAKYINNLKGRTELVDDFDISVIMEKFRDNIKYIEQETDYYPIIQEIAKLNRTELIEFKKRLSLSFENSESEDFILPYRIYSPRTDCAFIFIPINSSKSGHWKIALNNYTMAHKYESKATKCIGVIIFRDPKEPKYFEVYWQLMNYEWEYDDLIEGALKDNYPFRKVTEKRIENRYE